MFNFTKILFVNTFLFIFIFLGVVNVSAQELVEDKTEILKAEVVEVLTQNTEELEGIGLPTTRQTLSIKILEGEKNGKVLTIENDYIIFEKGDKFFLYYTLDAIDGRESYSVRDIDRRPVIFFFIGLFVAVVLLFSGRQGVRSLLGLLGSFFVILYLLIPSLLAGYPPVLTSIVVATIILFLAIYLTHGFNRISTVAFSGTVIAVIFTGILAYVGVTFARFTGFATEEAFYLNLNTRGVLDFTGLLLGGIMIGVLGVLDDIAITQSAVVRELYSSAPHLSKKEVYRKALNVGKEHVGALVNTLALAYTGASLPLLLLFYSSNSLGVSIINQEIFATEIIRTIVGSIGLILTVPITTLLAVYFLKDYKGTTLPNAHIGHTH